MASQVAHWIIVTVVTGIGAAWLLHTGPVPVIRVTTPLEENAPFWYMLSPFPVLGMLVAELAGVIATHGIRRISVGLGLSIAVLVLVSHFRLVIRLPISGHSALLSFFILRRALLSYPGLVSRKVELWIAVVMLLGVIYIKLIWWTDPITLTVGALTGALIFVMSRFISQGTNMEIAQRHFSWRRR